jgi:Alpha-L-arabinofuranosidase B (ABFB) domain
MLSDEQRRRLEQEKKSFEQSYELQSEKVARLRNALVIETDPSRKFQYEQQIKNEETELKRLTDRLDEIEKQLQSAQSIPVISELKSIQQQEAQRLFCLGFFPILVNTDEILQEYDNSTIFLNSTNFPDHYIRHQDGRGKIFPIKSNDNQGKQDASFRIIRIPNREGIFFESVNFSNRFLRNCRGRIVLEKCEGRNDVQSRYDDAAFNIYHGLDGDSDSYSFEAINYPGKFLRHRNGDLRLESACENKNIATFKGDASFKIITNPIFLP